MFSCSKKKGLAYPFETNRTHPPSNNTLNSHRNFQFPFQAGHLYQQQTGSKSSSKVIMFFLLDWSVVALVPISMAVFCLFVGLNPVIETVSLDDQLKCDHPNKILIKKNLLVPKTSSRLSCVCIAGNCYAASVQKCG